IPWDNARIESNPEGVASRSPGLPSAASLGQRKNRIQPRRGCVPQPRVAVRGYPGTTQESNPTPKGLRPTAQGCCPRLPWDNARIESNPEGVASHSPRGCRPRLPWDNARIESNPEGVASHSPGLPSAATLGQRKNRIQPRRGCVPQPRVAVRGYPGTTQESNPTPKGLRPTAQGCSPRLPWDNARIESNPEGVASRSPGLQSAATLGQRKNRIQPRRGCVPQPRVAVRGYPETTQESNPTRRGCRSQPQGCRPRLP